MLRIFNISGWWMPVLCVLVLFGGHFAIGANTNALALLLAGLGFGLCLLSLAFIPRISWILTHRNFLIALLLFTITWLMLCLQLTMYLPGGAHPFWQWTSAPPVVTLDRDATLRELIKLGALGAVFVTGLVVGADDKRAMLLFHLLILVGALFAVWAFVEYITQANLAVRGNVQSHLRLTAGFLSANSAAALFGMLCILSLAAVLRSAKQIIGESSKLMAFIEHLIRNAPVAIIALLFTLTSLLFTASRGGVLACLVAISVFAVWEIVGLKGSKNSGSKIIGVFFLAFILMVLIFLNSSELVVDRLDGTSASAENRWQIMSAHWQAFLAAPWTGYGLGTFYLINDMSMNAQNWGALRDNGAVHNVYLQWLEEAGIIGTALMFTTIGFILWVMYRGLRLRRRMRTWIKAILCISILLLLHGTVDYGLQIPSLAMMWALLLGTGFGLSTKRPD